MYRRNPGGWNWKILIGLGSVLLWMTTAVAEEKSPAQAHLQAALDHYKRLEFDEALAELDKAQRRARTPEETVTILLYEGILLSELSRQEEATASFEAALRLRPDAVLPLEVSPKIKQRLDAVRETVKAQAPAQPRPTEPGPQIEQPVPLPAPPLEAAKPGTSKPATPRDAPEQRVAPPEPLAHAPQGEIIPRELPVEEGWSFSPGRLVLELLGGTGGALVGGAAGAVLGLASSSLICDGDDDCALAAVLVGLSAGGVGGLSMGTYGVGRIMGGRGGLGFTLLGTVAGAALGTGVGLVTSSSVMGLSIAVGTLVGAVLGFELSHEPSASVPGARSRTFAALSVLPTLGVTRRGQFLAGLTGRF